MSELTLHPTEVGCIIVFSKNNCVQCTAVKRKLTDLVPFTEVNAETDTTVYETLGSRTAQQYLENIGELMMPCVEIRDAKNTYVIDRWTGRRPDKLLQLKRTVLAQRAETGGDAS